MHDASITENEEWEECKALNNVLFNIILDLLDTEYLNNIILVFLLKCKNKFLSHKG